MSGVKIVGVFVALSAGVSGCMLDSAEPPLDEGQIADGDASTSKEGTAEASSDINMAVIPTCNLVESFHQAWVPYYNGTPSTVDCSMIRGYSGPAVLQLQRTLSLCYHEALAVNGAFDAATETALRRTQRLAGTTPDGKYGRETRKVMLHEPANGGRCVHVP